MPPTSTQYAEALAEIEEDTARRSVAALKPLDGIPTALLEFAAAQTTQVLRLCVLERIVRRYATEAIMKMDEYEFTEHFAANQKAKGKLVELMEVPATAKA